MNEYRALMKRQQKELNEFPMMFAFNREQFEEGMRKLGLDPGDADKVYRLGDTGGFFRKTDEKALDDLFDRHNRELKESIAADKDGTGFIRQMFAYELDNHEYVITGDIEEVIRACNLTEDEVNGSKALRCGLALALKRYRNR